MKQIKVPNFLENAFVDKYSCSDEEGNNYEYYKQSIGSIKIVDRQIIACDPFLYNKDKPFVIKFPSGYFPVELAIAKINIDERVGLARIKFSEESPVKWTFALTEDQDESDLDDDEILGYGVDSGTGCFMDSSGAKKFSSYLSLKPNNFENIIKELALTYKDTRSWLLWKRDEQTVVMFSTGWGDGCYATYIGYDSKMSICRLVTDFGLINWQI